MIPHNTRHYLLLVSVGVPGKIRWVVEPNSDRHRISRPMMQDMIWLDRIDVPLRLEFVVPRCRAWRDRPNAEQRRMLRLGEMSRAAFCLSFRRTAEVQRGTLVRERYRRCLLVGKCGIDGCFRHRMSGGDASGRHFIYFFVLFLCFFVRFHAFSMSYTI